ncbi:hypothetical protein GCM10009555_047120 [Acrocarpospora macrocephala]|uniref:Uncharacterized protein n=1 Tax=Acrocarpospora macrocephala TaxID=150177 RepID=A0A5M3WT40_9ACTN|nr:hypothetical protein [Acrocarpospora macrocephala]GES12054.1 hypothetical protein Amac_056510 [Acrocarpospora macrocephala]
MLFDGGAAGAEAAAGGGDGGWLEQAVILAAAASTASTARVYSHGRILVAYCTSPSEVARHVDLADLVEVIAFRTSSALNA